MKLVIEINDMKNEGDCIRAVKQFYEALKEHHGEKRAECLILGLGEYVADPDYVETLAEAIAQKKFGDVCGSFEPENLRIVLEYYKMPKKSKLGLARQLAEKNETLPDHEKYGRGTTDPQTMLKQIKRILKSEGCRRLRTLPRRRESGPCTRQRLSAVPMRRIVLEGGGRPFVGRGRSSNAFTAQNHEGGHFSD
jgi:hypothetical protein